MSAGEKEKKSPLTEPAKPINRPASRNAAAGGRIRSVVAGSAPQPPSVTGFTRWWTDSGHGTAVGRIRSVGDWIRVGWWPDLCQGQGDPLRATATRALLARLWGIGRVEGGAPDPAVMSSSAGLSHRIPSLGSSSRRATSSSASVAAGLASASSHSSRRENFMWWRRGREKERGAGRDDFARKHLIIEENPRYIYLYMNVISGLDGPRKIVTGSAY